ncbi:hypothetical protein LK09_01105 [Microbacterium mangrovi]|uniref:HTH luxR-type domain-containing protein n=1 Tax=Microbacterium mangrovi TaxID=1348253 RepID=A0A0B2A8R5_9MICO|nr:LuxR family transcriptional regulator [Microbacterium mangrovi]KHK99948.1 hypothetical protein LK09_01105 [Microbacterium mangrovi]
MRTSGARTAPVSGAHAVAESGARAVPASGSVFVGRDAELARLTDALDADELSTGRFVVVLGEGGIGKTSLIEAALQRLSGRPVLRGAADAMDGRRTYGLLLDAFAPRLTEDDRRLAAGANEHAVGERLLAVIDEVAATPLVLVLEDLQWADPASLALLARLARTLEQLPLVVVGSMRTQARHETPPALDNLLSVLSERGLLQPMELTALPQSACVTIAERLTGGHVDGALARYVAASGGNPLFLTEMLRSLLRDGAVTIDAGGEAVLDAPVGPSPSLAMVMMRHLSHLSAPTRELLTSAALLGTRFPMTQLRVVAGQPMSALVPLLRESFAAGFLEEADHDLLGFRHELIQEVLLQDLPAPVRAELQREVAVRLDAAGAPASVVAGHLLQARTSPEDLPWMLQLAQRTSVGAPATATELWERVVHATEPHDALHVRAVAGLARAALSAGHAAESTALAERALQQDVPADVLPALTSTYTHALMQEHRNAASRAESERYAASDLLDPADRAAHLAFAGWPQFMLGDVEGAKRLAREGAALAVEVGNPGAEVLALAVHGQIADFQGDLDEAIALLSRAAALADRHLSFASVEAFPHAQLALALTDAQRDADAAGLLHHGLQLSEQFGYRTGVLAAHAFGAQVLSHTASFSDIAAELDAHHTLVGSMDVRMSGPVLGLRAWLVAHQRGPEAALEWARRLSPIPERAAWAGRGRGWIWLGLSQRERARGDEVAALEVLWDGWQELRATDMLMDCAELGLDLAELVRTVIDAHPSHSSVARSRADEIVRVLTGLADRNPAVTHLRATALAVHGRVSGDAGALVEAAGLLAGTSRRFDHARVAEFAAVALPARDDARRMLAEASLHGYTEVGADHDLVRARAAFRHAGIPGLTRPRARPAFGWESLTRTEERIAGFVATGATNPEIAGDLSVSRRTVETHVSNILTKLGLRSRTELAVFVARRLEEAGQHGQ